MKKVLSFIIAAVMILGLAATAAATTYGYLRGDVNDDGVLSMKDVLAIRRLLAGDFGEDEAFVLAADVDGDGAVTMKDVLKLRKIIAGAEDAEGNNTDNQYKVTEFKIGGRNVGRFTIVYPETAPGEEYVITSMHYSAGEMKNYIRDACGIELNESYTDNFTGGRKIEYRYDVDDEYGLGKEGFVFECTDEGDFIITCGTRRGAVYATYTFLEDFLGYRFLTDSITYLYKSEKCEIPTGYYDCQIPTLDYRAIGANDPGSLFAQLKVNGSDGGASPASKGGRAWEVGGAVGTTYLHAHSFVYYMAGFENRYDPNLDSVAGGTQPCMTDEKTYEAIIDFMYKCVEWRTEGGQVPGFHYTQVSCSANDNGNFCTCANCKAIYMEEESVAGALIRLCNRVTEKFCADYPMLDIYTAAYAGCHIAPKMTRPDPRLNICFCCVGCNNHSLRETEVCREHGGNTRLLTYKTYDGEMIPQSNVEWMGWLSDWLELTDNVWFWYYTDNWAYYVSPAPNIFNFYDDIKYLTEKGVKGFYLEGDSDRINYSFEALRIYLETKIMWHPEMTEEEYCELADEFLKIYYGKGWENMRELLYMENRCGDLEGCWTNNFDYPWNEYNKEYYRENYEHFLELIDAAYNATKDGQQKERIEKCSMHVNFLGLSATYERDWVNGDAASQAKYRERYEWLWNYIKNRPNQLLINSTFLAAEGTPGGLWEFPSNPNNPCDPMNWVLGDGWTGIRE